MRSSVLVVLFGLALLSGLAVSLSSKDVAAIQKAVTSYFGFVPQYGAPCNPCVQGDNIGALVRLIFHDAFGGGGQNNNGGVNACVDFKTAANNGLQEVIGQLDEIYPAFASKISKADFWLIAANTAVKYATTATQGPSQPGLDPTPGPLILPFRYGRKDDATCDDSNRLPGTGFSWKQMTDMFVKRIGLNVRQFVALMGAHSLGRAEYKNSGIEGGWTLTQSTLTNGFFASLGAVPWVNSNNSDIWVNSGSKPATVMFRVDIEALYSPATNCPKFVNFSQTGNCHYNKATGNPSGYFFDYVADIRSFFGNFSQAWQVLSEFNYNNLKSL